MKMKVQLHVTLVDMEQCHRAGLHFAPFVIHAASQKTFVCRLSKESACLGEGQRAAVVPHGCTVSCCPESCLEAVPTASAEYSS